MRNPTTACYASPHLRGVRARGARFLRHITAADRSHTRRLRRALRLMPGEGRARRTR
jgi:hypothetical protein